MDKRLYIVTLKEYQDLDQFYLDMETPGGSKYIPSRNVECSLRRPLSRNTHYYLTPEEAELLLLDDRVLDVQLPPEELGIKFKRKTYTQTADFDKSNQPNSDSVNWGLYRQFLNGNVTGWGADATPVETATVNYKLTGKNVDVVIIDELIDSNHPEFAVNADGTGGSRIQTIDWFSYNSQVTGLGDLDGQTLPRAPFRYLADITENHGPLCGSTAAGNIHGLAKNANIYTIDFTRPRYAKFIGTTTGNQLSVGYIYDGSGAIQVGDRLSGPGLPFNGVTIQSFGTGTGGTGTYTLSASVTTNETSQDFYAVYSGNWDLLLWDYIRAFHRFKPINPATGRRNPTIVNASYGLSIAPTLANISSVVYRGTTYTSSNTTWTMNNLQNSFGVMKENDFNFVIPSDYTAYGADLQDAINDGVLVVNAAGNDSAKIDVVGGLDYNNYVVISGTTYYYHRGDVFARNPKVVVVGGIGADQIQKKADFSSCGPRVDVFAASVNIVGAANFTEEFNFITQFSVTSNVATFYTDSGILFDIGAEVDIYIDGITELSGVFTVTDLQYEQFQTEPTIFKVNVAYADTALTPAFGSVIGYYTDRGNFPLDSRAPYYYLYNNNGTSFAAPQVTGLLACWMEVYNRFTYRDAYGLLIEKGEYDTITEAASIPPNYSNFEHLQGATNLISKYAEERFDEGMVYPKTNFKSRFEGVLANTSYYFPRPRIFRYGSVT